MTIWLLISALLNPMQSRMVEVVLSVKVGVFGVLCHKDSPTDDTDMIIIASSVFCHLVSFTALYHIINVGVTGKGCLRANYKARPA